MTMIKIGESEFGDAMEYLHKAKKYMKKALELIETGEEGSRRGMSKMGRRHDTSRFDDEDYD